MKASDAAEILGLAGEIDRAAVKVAYRQAAMRYHPDRNPAGAEMMQMVNAAYEALRDFAGELAAAPDQGEVTYPAAVNAALNAIIALAGLEIEVCGAWVWVTGATYLHRAELKAAGFRYASKKQRWYFRPEGWRSVSRGAFSMDDIRDKYGSSSPNFTPAERLAS